MADVILLSKLQSICQAYHVSSPANFTCGEQPHHVLAAINHSDVAVGLHLCQVTSLEPSVRRDCRARGFSIAQGESPMPTYFFLSPCPEIFPGNCSMPFLHQPAQGEENRNCNVCDPPEKLEIHAILGFASQ
eukprot:1156706-Pelagomonas_calceolata.AAC.9